MFSLGKKKNGGREGNKKIQRSRDFDSEVSRNIIIKIPRVNKNMYKYVVCTYTKYKVYNTCSIPCKQYVV